MAKQIDDCSFDTPNRTNVMYDDLLCTLSLNLKGNGTKLLISAIQASEIAGKSRLCIYFLTQVVTLPKS